MIVLHTGRLTGNVAPLSVQATPYRQYYPLIAGYIDKVRAEAAGTDATVILLDSGDSLSGSFASHVTDARNMITFFNTLKYDVICLGNLDNDIRPGIVEEIDAKVLCPFMAADGKPAMPGAAFGVTLHKNGLPVTVLANFYGNTTKQEQPHRFPTFFGPNKQGVEPVRDYAKVLQELGAADKQDGLVLLNWHKFEVEDKPPVVFLDHLAQIGVDAAVGHQIYSGGKQDVWRGNNLFEWSIPVSANILRHNQGFTVARLDLKRDGVGWRVLNQHIMPMSPERCPTDKAIVQALNQYSNVLGQAQVQVAVLDKPYAKKDILDRYMNALGSLADPHAVIYSIHSIRGDWQAGTLLAGDVFTVLPWTTPLVQMQVSPEQMEKIKALKSIEYKEIKPLGNPIKVTTSTYFAALCKEHAGVKKAQIETLEQASEFDFFVDVLKKNQ